ncbi:MAG: DNA topoisomerase IV subunit A [Rhodospirillales bacterium]|nr:DNA topoisomerase IV subunit A [Rhodospirillales bacterium]
MPKPAPAGVIRDTNLAEALGDRYLAYALSTIVSRSLPDVRDGLKPVHRRLLYAMRQLKLDPKSGYKKCARVVGDVIGKYHPHGDVAVYDALVRLAQDFAQRYPLVDGQGNFGNIDGDNAAAMRYTEARMTSVALALLDGIDEDAVDFRTTYDGEESEPIVLPGRFPNLLANGAAGIAVGMATSIPPHNVSEICNALIHLIKFPKARTETLVEFIPGPDFPTGGILVEPREAVLEAYRTGRGGFRIRAKWEVEKLSHGLYQIVVTEIPYHIHKARLIEKIAELMNQKKLPLLADILDESSSDLRIVLEPRNRLVEPEMLMEHMFRLTDMETRFALNMNVLDKGNTPGVMGLREILLSFLDHRHEVLKRRTKYRLDKIENRLEILAGLLIAYLNLDQIIYIIRNEDEPKPKLRKTFKLTDNQAEAILNMRLRQLRKLEEKEIKRENDDLTREQKSLKGLLRDEKRRWGVITDEISEIKNEFGPKTELGRRRTEIGDAPSVVVVPLEAMIEKEPITVVCSEKGWIRTIKGHIESPNEVKYKEGDRGKFVIHAQTTDKLLVFGTNGRFYTLGCDKLPGGRGHGEPLRLMIDLTDGHDLIGMFLHEGGRWLLVASDQGRGFVVEEDDVVAQTKAGKQVLNLGSDEEAAAVAVVEEGDDFIAVTGTNNRLLLFPMEELPLMARGRGVIMQRYSNGHLRDVTTFNRKKGLIWHTGRGEHVQTRIKDWIGKRGQAGRKPFKGFPKSNRFT